MRVLHLKHRLDMLSLAVTRLLIKKNHVDEMCSKVSTFWLEWELGIMRKVESEVEVEHSTILQLTFKLEELKEKEPEMLRLDNLELEEF